ncbi:MAG TPA: serine/threonine-protein kinase [Gemmataceae bacterium]|nr:serine/threonine-protein kinase [Gemmataceae bacterium]
MPFLKVPNGASLDAVAAQGEGGRALASVPAPPGYEILEELGRGGMGVVYKARHVPINRRVALKMVLAGGHAGPHELNRFRKEAEAIARLEHPHIVRLYDFGDLNGLPYFSMELVDGGNLAHKLGGTPQPAKPAAQLVETLARAIHYAHEQGIIHRDLKPANILLRVQSSKVQSSKSPGRTLNFELSNLELINPKIADFGLVKRLDVSSVPTQTGAIMGTTSYMAPEQARGETTSIGPATDVYALGAILYELLTGRPPFRADSPLETLRQVASDEPISVSRLRANVPRDLTTVCQKCLEKEPGYRYPSALALADDLHRFLAGQPILARRAGVGERLCRWSRRNPVVAGLTAAVILLFLAGFGGVAWQWRRAETNYRRADASYQQAEQGFRLTRDALERLIEVIDVDLRAKPGNARLRQRILADLLTDCQTLVDQRPSDPAARVELGRTYTSLGVAATEVGTASEALVAYRQAVAQFELARNTDPDRPITRHQLGATLFYMGLVLRATGRVKEALEAHHRALVFQEALFSESPHDIDYRRTLALNSWAIGDAEAELGHIEQARAWYKKAQALQEGLVRQTDSDAFLAHLAYTHNSIGVVLEKMGRPVDGLERLGQARALRATVVNRDPTAVEPRYDLARTELCIAAVEDALGRQADARHTLDHVRTELETLVHGDPERVDFQRTLAETYLQLGKLNREQGTYAEALRRLGQAQKLAGCLLAQDPAILQSRVIQAEAAEEIGLTRKATAQPDAARVALQQSLAAWQRLAHDHPTLPRLQRGLAGIDRQLAQLQAASGSTSPSRRSHAALRQAR